jgi:hypothetical protein
MISAKLVDSLILLSHLLPSDQSASLLCNRTPRSSEVSPAGCRAGHTRSQVNSQSRKATPPSSCFGMHVLLPNSHNNNCSRRFASGYPVKPRYPSSLLVSRNNRSGKSTRVISAHLLLISGDLNGSKKSETT